MVLPVISTSRAVTPSAGSALRTLPEANGLPAALSAPSCTLPSGSISSSDPHAGNPPPPAASTTTGRSGRLNSAARGAIPAARQSPGPATSA